MSSRERETWGYSFKQSRDLFSSNPIPERKEVSVVLVLVTRKPAKKEEGGGRCSVGLCGRHSTPPPPPPLTTQILASLTLTPPARPSLSLHTLFPPPSPPPPLTLPLNRLPFPKSYLAPSPPHPPCCAPHPPLLFRKGLARSTKTPPSPLSLTPFLPSSSLLLPPPPPLTLPLLNFGYPLLLSCTTAPPPFLLPR